MEIKKPKVKTRKVILLAILVLVLLAVIAFGGAYLYYQHALTAIEDCETSDCKTISFTVAENTGGTKIARDLEDAGLIRSALAFCVYLKLEEHDASLKSGEYQFNTGMDVAHIVQSLETGVVAQTFKITFLPGGTLAAARERLQNLGYRDEEITQAFNASYDHPLLKTKPADATLEGYIYGETYEFYVGESVENILKRVFDEMYQVVQSNNLEAQYQKLGLNLHEGITLASVVQSEAGIMSYVDQQQVAQVFELRLQRGMALGSDAIIAYRADQLNPNRSKSDMSYLNTITCPWNSRKCIGLPPTPISNPGKNALLAVANPAAGDYLYFISGYNSEGKVQMYYARTQAEHDANIRNYCGDLCSLL